MLLGEHEFYPDVFVNRQKLRNKRRNEFSAECRRRADANTAAQLGCVVDEFITCCVDFAKCGSNPCGEFQARRSRLHTARGSVEQGRVQITLERCNGAAHRLQRSAQRSRSGCQTSFVNNSQQYFIFVRVHDGHSLASWKNV
nr:hypothetical protein [Paraburkholderia saeva]